MGAGIGDIRPHIANLVLNDGPFIGTLAATPSVQEAIIELVQEAINSSVIVVPGVGLTAYRVAPTILVPYSAAVEIPAVTMVLNSATPGTPPALSGLVTDTGGNSATPSSTPAASPPIPAGAIILGVVSIHAQQITAGPSGFQRICSNYDPNTEARIELWAKLAVGGETTFDWTADGANFWSTLVGVYTGVATNALAAAGDQLQQPNGASPYLVSQQLVGPWSTDSILCFAGCTFGGATQSAAITASGGSNLMQRAGSIGESQFWAEIEF